MHVSALPDLPCFPCPHRSACCFWGASITDDERAQIEARFGAAFVAWSEEESGYRTAMKDGRCVFLADNRCTVHGEEFYPSMCRNFPTRNLSGDGPYEHDVSICPELAPLVDPDTKRLRLVEEVRS